MSSPFKSSFLHVLTVILLASMVAAAVYVVWRWQKGDLSLSSASERDSSLLRKSEIGSPPVIENDTRSKEAAKVIAELTQFGATVYEYKGRIAVCFGALGPPFPVNQKPEQVTVSEKPGFDWRAPNKSTAECEQILDAIARLSHIQPVVYVDLARLDISKSRVERFRRCVPCCKVLHAREYAHWFPRTRIGDEPDRVPFEGAQGDRQAGWLSCLATGHVMERAL